MQMLAHVEVTNYNYRVQVSICRETNSIHIFKYNDLHCDYDVFYTQESAQRFIEQPLL
jgi:hypothetical protein